VMNTYNGWKGEDELFEPRPGLTAFLKVLQREGNQIVIFTNRPVEKVNTWLEKYGVDSFIAYVTNTKPLAHVYVDDRAVTFEGNLYNTYMRLPVSVLTGKRISNVWNSTLIYPVSRMISILRNSVYFP